MSNNSTSRYLSYVRPTSYWDVVCYHMPMALVTGIPLFLSLVATPGGLPLKACTFKALTHYPCPFCGFTRSFFAMASGDWAYAFYNCPLACALFVLCIVVFIWSLAGLVAGVKLSIPDSLIIKTGQGKYLGIAIGLLFLLNWVYRLYQGLT